MNIAEKKEEILEACRKATKVLRSTWGVYHPVGCGCPLTLFAESIGWERSVVDPDTFLEALDYTEIESFIEGFDGDGECAIPDRNEAAFVCGIQVRLMLDYERVKVHEVHEVDSL